MIDVRWNNSHHSNTSNLFIAIITTSNFVWKKQQQAELITSHLKCDTARLFTIPFCSYKQNISIYIEKLFLFLPKKNYSLPLLWIHQTRKGINLFLIVYIWYGAAVSKNPKVKVWSLFCMCMSVKIYFIDLMLLVVLAELKGGH